MEFPLKMTEDCLIHQTVCVHTCNKQENHQFRNICPCSPLSQEHLVVTTPSGTSSSGGIAEFKEGFVKLCEVCNIVELVETLPGAAT